jgi:hypothetical protein
MNNQEVFDAVVTHLRMQGRKSIDPFLITKESEVGAGCFYRGPDGLKCAAGCLITDEEYRPWMEGYAINCIINNHTPYHMGETPRSLMERLQDRERIVAELQQCHDHFSPEEWETHFQQIAIRFGITYTPKETT